tara:strand:- start:218 stop:553 length:336 start_codon:yes stop_codon:yes gene_type:complete
MAHFAELDSNNIVLRVIVVADEHEDDGENWCNNFTGGTWKQTSYNNNIRKQFAGAGYTYDADKDKFISPEPFASWALDGNDDWQPPTACPDDDKVYNWDEDNLAWVEFKIE